MKTATSATIFRDAVGLRISVTYSDIDQETGKILTDNQRLDRVITDSTQIKNAEKILQIAQETIEQ